MLKDNKVQVSIIGAGFSGLSAAYELVKQGINVCVIESESEVGGLAAAFDVEGEKLDRFYHHWFTNDEAVMNLIKEFNLMDKVEISPTNTGIYYANNFFKLSTPFDLLKFKPLSLIDRFRLGLLALKARRVKDWELLEKMTAKEWLINMGGLNVYKVIWEPLLKGKFGPYAESVSAVWFWNKLKLRGGSRGKGGEERLAYFKGGFIALAKFISKKMQSSGGELLLNTKVLNARRNDGKWIINTNKGYIYSDRVIFTTSLPIIANIIDNFAKKDFLKSLRRIHYIGNICLVLELNESLSDTYWLNVNDPSFPFVGVIEHTNFESPKTYGGRHIVYLSKYLPHTDKIYSMNADQFLEYALPFLKKMFPHFKKSLIFRYHLWKARWSQPVVEKNYSSLIPMSDSPIEGMHICSMAQIYPEDRGTNYAIREGRKIGKRIAKMFRE